MIEGQLIVIEGIDGSGTTTHARLLAEALRREGLPVHATREPSDGPVGMMLRQILTRRIVVPGLRGPRPPSWTTMALLFAADRMDHLDAEVIPNLLDGVHVVSDRYVHSSVAYQSLGEKADSGVAEWILSINRHARPPDITIVLDVPWQVAAERRKARPQEEMYENAEHQMELAAFYSKMERYFPGENIVHLNADRPVDQVRADILARVMAHRAKG